jgi:hypothetical protein
MTLKPKRKSNLETNGGRTEIKMTCTRTMYGRQWNYEIISEIKPLPKKMIGTTKKKWRDKWEMLTGPLAQHVKSKERRGEEEVLLIDPR